MHRRSRTAKRCWLSQDNLLWEQLTGAEHLEFYGRLKGLKGELLAMIRACLGMPSNDEGLLGPAPAAFGAPFSRSGPPPGAPRGLNNTPCLACLPPLTTALSGPALTSAVEAALKAVRLHLNDAGKRRVQVRQRVR